MRQFRIDAVEPVEVGGVISSNAKDYTVPLGMNTIVWLSNKGPTLLRHRPGTVLLHSEWVGESFTGEYVPYRVTT